MALVFDKEIKISNFLSQHGEKIKATALSKMKPLYDNSNEDPQDFMARDSLKRLNRLSYEPQNKASLAMLKGFKHHKALFMVGEMGTGKTQISAAVIYGLIQKNKHKKGFRTLVMCPSHLVEKWKREVMQVVPGVKAKILSSVNDIATGKPKGNEVWILSKETAKLHYTQKLSLAEYVTKSGRYTGCPHCGEPVSLDDAKEEPFCKGKIKVSSGKHRTCGTTFYAPADYRRYAIAKFLNKKKVKLDLAIFDEVHELKGGDTAQGEAMALITGLSRKVLCLTGTLSGGYASNLFYLLYRLFPEKMEKKGYRRNSVSEFIKDYGVLETIETFVDAGPVASIRKRKGVRTEERPGISPSLIPDFLLEVTYFLKLEEMSEELPPFTEMVNIVNMDAEQAGIYRKFEDQMLSLVNGGFGRSRFLGSMINSLLSLPDRMREGEKITDPDDRGYVAASTEEYHPGGDGLLPKERELLNIINAEKAEGRKVLIYLENTGKRDIQPLLSGILSSHGIENIILKSSVPARKREGWVKSQLRTNPKIDAMICNPNLVKTGLDLLEFPTIIYYQTGYSIYTLRQSSRRSWRLGQTREVRVIYMAYKDTMQERALSLTAQKLETSLVLEGDLSDDGLVSLSSNNESMAISLARELLEHSDTDLSQYRKYKYAENKKQPVPLEDVSSKIPMTEVKSKGQVVSFYSVFDLLEAAV